ncbi:hypothetical protein LguiA_016237 [Lonicera macranthoides]
MKRTVTMNWESLGDDDDDDFYDSNDRISSASAQDADYESDDSDDEEFDDSRASFSNNNEFCTFKSANNPPSMFNDFNTWMADPGDIKDRRKKLLQGMGLGSNKSFMKLASAKINRIVSKKVEIKPSDSPGSSEKSKGKTQAEAKPESEAQAQSTSAQAQTETELVVSAQLMLVRSRSDGDLESFSIITEKRKEGLLGSTSKQRLTRTSSMILTPSIGICQFARVEPIKGKSKFGDVLPTDQLGTFFLIKNLDTGKEFIVKESSRGGMWKQLSDVETGKQLSIEEFEKSVGHSPVVKELICRNASSSNEETRKAIINANNYLSKSFRYSMRQGANLLKNIKGVASGIIGDKDMNVSPSAQQSGKNESSQWVKIRHQGKSFKELTGLHMCQEIQAHEGSIWTIKFSLDARYLASAGEDKVIHIWEVQECDVMMMKPSDDSNNSSAGTPPVHPMPAAGNSDRPPLADMTPTASEKKKKGKNSNRKKSSGIPDYVRVPETVFGLSEKPICTFKGHMDDILDLSWSKTELLLSSSMDKTVRLWNMESQDCLKMFAHSDYVTCVQFNPVNDDYFISGSLDAKVRIWNISARKVVDWTDLNEMVTATCFTPDGQGALVGSHKGNCRLYSTTDCKLEQKEIFEIRNKKKSPAKKITGFQFAPSSSSEVLLSCADSRIRVMQGSNVVQKFAGLRNINSQIAASFTPNGKYVISASEDSHVYMWKRDEPRNVGVGKPKTVTTSTHAHEQFLCKEVSVAIPWPGSIKNIPPIVEVNKRHSKKPVPQGVYASGSPTREEVAKNSKKDLPPLPKKNTNSEKSSSSPDEDSSQVSRTESDIGSESFASDASSVKSVDSPSVKSGEPPSTNPDDPPSTKSGESPSISTSANSGSQLWSWFDVGGHGGQTIEATAWGLVIVTAGLGGEIRAYQNFGLPLKVNRQAFSLPQK